MLGGSHCVHAELVGGGPVVVHHVVPEERRRGGGAFASVSKGGRLDAPPPAHGLSHKKWFNLQSFNKKVFVCVCFGGSNLGGGKCDAGLIQPVGGAGGADWPCSALGLTIPTH